METTKTQLFKKFSTADIEDALNQIRWDYDLNSELTWSLVADDCLLRVTATGLEKSFVVKFDEFEMLDIYNEDDED